MERELTIVIKDGEDIEQVVAKVVDAGLEHCTPYAALSIIMGKVAVVNGSPDSTIYDRLRAIPEIDSISGTVIYHALKD